MFETSKATVVQHLDVNFSRAGLMYQLFVAASMRGLPVIL